MNQEAEPEASLALARMFLTHVIERFPKDKSSEWVPFLCRAHRFISDRPALASFLDKIESIGQHHPGVAEYFINSRDIPDDSIRRIFSIQMIRRHLADRHWWTVFREFRIHRYSLFQGAIAKELQANREAWNFISST